MGRRVKTASSSAVPLRLVEHPYYCNESNYFNSDCVATFDSWADFLDSEGDADLDWNLVFRFDWSLPMVDPVEESDHSEYLTLFYVGQRKGLFRSVKVRVRSEDDSSARAWLQVRWEHLQRLWTPLSPAPVELKNPREYRVKDANRRLGG